MRRTRVIGVLLGLTIGILLVAGSTLALNYLSSSSQWQRVVRAYDAASTMRQTLIAALDAESGHRGYLLTGRKEHLATYEQARLRLDGLLRDLEAVSVDAPEQAKHAATLRAATVALLDELASMVEAYEVQGRDAAPAILRTGRDRAPLEAVRLTAEAYIEAQQDLLALRLAQLRADRNEAILIGAMMFGGALACLFGALYLILQEGRHLKAAQRELLARSRLLQTTLETLRDPLVVFDAEGGVVAWNEPFAHLAGWNPEEQRHLTRAALESDRFATARELLRPLRSPGPPAAGQSIERVSAAGRDYEIFIGQMADGGVVVRGVDITEKVRTDMALRQGQKMEAIGQLTGGMAHDFNNILQVVQSNLELLREDVRNDPAASARLANALAGTQRGARLTQQLLAFARRQPLAPLPVDVGRLVRDMADLLRHSLGERVVVELDLAPDAWNTKIDLGQLENAILNLAINARDAMAGGGTVRVAVANATLDRNYATLHPDAAPGAYVVVSVTDTGTGMPPEVVARAFDPFFTTKRDDKGTGLGLSMVYGFARQSGGHVRIDSEPGRGTSVKMYLPRTLEPVVDLFHTAPVAWSGSERILVVEDNEDVRRAVVAMLEDLGYRVASVDGPDAAKALLEDDPAFDILFTDVVMAGTLSAVELADAARRLRPDIAVLLTSGYAKDAVPEWQGGQDGYPMITKPYRQEDLATKLRSVLAAARAPAPDALAPGEPATAAVGPDVPARRVLFVEDEVLVRMSTSDMLERLGCDVETAASGEQALDLLVRRGPFDMMIADLGLPGMSGEQLATEAQRMRPGLRIVIASGYGAGVSRHVLSDKFRFIGKPYSIVDLRQVVEQAMREDADPAAGNS